MEVVVAGNLAEFEFLVDAHGTLDLDRASNSRPTLFVIEHACLHGVLEFGDLDFLLAQLVLVLCLLVLQLYDLFIQFVTITLNSFFLIFGSFQLVFEAILCIFELLL